MTKRKNPFVRIKQYFVEDDGDVHWWVDEEDVEAFKESWCENEDGRRWEDYFKGETREMSGKKWNEWMIGNPWGDYEGTFVDEDCPTCGCFLVKPSDSSMDDFKPTGEERHCSDHDCEYLNDDWQRACDAKEAYWKDFRQPKPPEIKIKVAGENVFDFAKRVGLQLDRKDGVTIKDDNYWSTCTVCKREVPCSDFFIGQETGFAIITFAHDNCTNQGPCVGTPFKKETKEEWGKLI